MTIEKYSTLEFRKLNYDLDKDAFKKIFTDLEMHNEQSLRTYGIYQVTYIAPNDDIPLSKLDKVLLTIALLFLVTPFVLVFGFLIHSLIN